VRDAPRDSRTETMLPEVEPPAVREDVFALLDPRLRASIEARGISDPTEIQRLGIPLLRTTQSDALLVAPTGTGKTEAALLPLLSRQIKDPSPPVSILYLTPLRALNRDLEHRLVSLASSVGLRAAIRHGDTPPSERTKQSRSPPDALVTTPETLQVLLVGRRLRQSLRGLRFLVVDEVHELFASDRGAQLALTLERLDALVGRPLRRIGLSATVSNPEAVARYLAPEPRSVEIRIAREPREVRILVRTPVVDTSRIDSARRAELRTDEEHLAALLAVEEEVRAHRATLIFVNTRPMAEGLGARLTRLAPDLPVAVHHGSLSRLVREEAERSFRAGELRALVATSSLELGIDIGAIDVVLQFGSPHQAGRLLQRVGRAGHRVGLEVRGILLAADDEELEEGAVLARRALAGEIEPVGWRTRNRLAAAQQIVAVLRAEGAVDLAPTVAQLRHAVPVRDLREVEWRELVDYLSTLGSLRADRGRLAPGRGTLNRFYSTLSLIPDEKTYRLRDIATRRPIGTLDERFVMTQILAEPELIFLLHGRTWRVVEFREDELLVETVSELGQEPRWVGEDLPVAYDAAQEIGRLRRSGDPGLYPLSAPALERLRARVELGRTLGVWATDRLVTVTAHGRMVVYGMCFGTRTNETLALAMAGLLTSRLGARVETLAVEPTWVVLGLPVALDPETLRSALTIPPDALEGLLERLVPASLEYHYVFLNVARKFGVLPVTADTRALRDLEPLIERSRTTPLGEEALEKTLHDRYDVGHARQVLERLREGDLEVRVVPPNPLADRPLERVRWRELPDVPPPTLLKAVADRLRQERLTLVCLRCGFAREASPARYRAEGGAVCRICHGALSAVLSPRRTEDIDKLVRYARRKRHAKRAPRAPPPALVPLIRTAYTSAELLATYGERALLALAGRGIGPDTARRILGRMYRTEDELLVEILRAERSYARTRAFWD
jgi:ATP-dependent Lhr-like helicase